MNNIFHFSTLASNVFTGSATRLTPQQRRLNLGEVISRMRDRRYGVAGDALPDIAETPRRFLTSLAEAEEQRQACGLPGGDRLPSPVEHQTTRRVLTSSALESTPACSSPVRDPLSSPVENQTPSVVASSLSAQDLMEPRVSTLSVEDQRAIVRSENTNSEDATKSCGRFRSTSIVYVRQADDNACIITKAEKDDDVDKMKMTRKEQPMDTSALKSEKTRLDPTRSDSDLQDPLDPTRSLDESDSDDPLGLNGVLKQAASTDSFLQAQLLEETPQNSLEMALDWESEELAYR